MIKSEYIIIIIILRQVTAATAAAYPNTIFLAIFAAAFDGVNLRSLLILRYIRARASKTNRVRSGDEIINSNAPPTIF